MKNNKVMNHRINQKQVAIYLFRILFLLISVYCLRKYLAYSDIINNKADINYKLIKLDVHRGGRGEYYTMDILYKYKEHSINITSKNYNNIQSSEFPKLYYSEDTNTVFSEWEKRKALRLTYLFFVGFVITLMPFYKILSFLRRKNN